MAKRAELFKANQSARVTVKGEVYEVREHDLIRAGHPLIAACPWLVDPAPDYVRFEVEQATAAPGEKRGDKH